MMKPLITQEQEVAQKKDALEGLVASKNTYLQLFHNIVEFEQKYLQLDQRDYIPAKNNLEKIISNCTKVVNDAVDNKPKNIEAFKSAHEKIQEQMWVKQKIKPQGQNYLLPVGISNDADCDTSAIIEMIALGQAGFDCELVLIQGHAILKVDVGGKDIYVETVSPNKKDYTYYNSSEEVETIYGQIYSEIKVHETDKFFSNILVNIALDYCDNDDYQKATEKFDEAIKLWPDNFYAHHQKTIQAFNHGDFETGAKQVEMMKKISLNAPQTYEMESVLRLTQQKYDDSFCAIENAVKYYMKLKPNPRQALAPTANAMFFTSIVILEKLIEEMPAEKAENKYSQADAYFLLGKIYYKLCQWEKATEAFADAKHINPNLEKIESYFMMAKNKGNVSPYLDYEHAIKLYSMAIDVEPDYPEHWERRADQTYEYLIRASGDGRYKAEDVISDYKMAYSLEDEEERIDVSQKLLKMLISVGRFDEAIEYLSKELKMDPENEELHMRRAQLYQIRAHFQSRDNDYKNAQKDYAYLIKNDLLDPPPEEIVRFLHMINKNKGIIGANIEQDEKKEIERMSLELIYDVRNKLAKEPINPEYSLMGMWYSYQLALILEQFKDRRALSYLEDADRYLGEVKSASTQKHRLSEIFEKKINEAKKRIDENVK